MEQKANQVAEERNEIERNELGEKIKSYGVIACHIGYLCLLLGVFSVFPALLIGVILAWLYSRKVEVSRMLKSHFNKQIKIGIAVLIVSVVLWIMALVSAPLLFWIGFGLMIAVAIVCSVVFLYMIIKNWIALFEGRPAC